MALSVPVVPFPMQITDGEFVMVEQDSAYDIEGCVEAVARCPQGHLDSLPLMGLADYALTRGAPPIAEIRDAITPYEPRAPLVADSTIAELVATVTIDPGVKP